jgi:hypothetical protein
MPRGGHRYGAGRPGRHPKAEHCLRLDVREFMRRGLLTPGAFTWSWHNSGTGERTGSVGVSIERHLMKLSFSVNGADAGHTIVLARTQCTFGGERTWFRCGRCSRRCAVLYLRSSTFRCRKCGGVVYASQSEDLIGRAWRRQRRLEQRLGDYWSRPKGMHQRTHEWLLERILRCEEVRDEALCSFLGRLGLRDW